jgi:hypothetical protein
MNNPIKQIWSKKHGNNDEEKEALLEKGGGGEKPMNKLLTEQHQPKSYARAVRHWNVKIPPAQKTMVGGRYMVPTFESALAGLLRKEYRISLEIHHVKDSTKDMTERKKYSEVDSKLRQEDLAGGFDSPLGEEEYVLLKVLRPLEPLNKISKEEQTGMHIACFSLLLFLRVRVCYVGYFLATTLSFTLSLL